VAGRQPARRAELQPRSRPWLAYDRQCDAWFPVSGVGGQGVSFWADGWTKSARLRAGLRGGPAVSAHRTRRPWPPGSPSSAPYRRTGCSVGKTPTARWFGLFAPIRRGGAMGNIAPCHKGVDILGGAP